MGFRIKDDDQPRRKVWKKIVSYVVITAVAAGLGGAVLSVGPWFLSANSRSLRRTQHEFMHNDTMDAVWMRFLIGAAVGGVVGFGFTVYIDRKIGDYG